MSNMSRDEKQSLKDVKKGIKYKDVLKKCRNLKNSDYKHISVQDDLTREEQEKQYKLRQELRKRKQEGERVCIYRGEIIPEDQRPLRNDH